MVQRLNERAALYDNIYSEVFQSIDNEQKLKELQAEVAHVSIKCPTIIA